MPNLKVKNFENKEVDEISLSDDVFGREPNISLLNEIVRMQRNKKRAGTACTKERNAIAGGGKKPFRQKGTGGARQGTLTAPNHRGGGTVFGPKPRSYAFTPPKKVRKGAMKSALSLLVKNDSLLVVDEMKLDSVKTSQMKKILDGLNLDNAVVVDTDDNNNVMLSVRNLANHMFLPYQGVNVYDLLKHKQLVISRAAVQELEKSLLDGEKKGEAK